MCVCLFWEQSRQGKSQIFGLPLRWTKVTELFHAENSLAKFDSLIPLYT
jgi:hypothetical protein